MDPEIRFEAQDRLLGRTADASLLHAAPAELPGDIGPAPAAPSSDHRTLVGAGATLTGVTLIGGGVLAVAGLVLLIEGASGRGLILLVVGLVLATTHWGWVHVAQTVADGRDRRRDLAAEGARAAWLSEIAPHPRWELRSHARDRDAAVVLERVRFDPVARGANGFGFASTVELAESHAEDVPAAAVAERAEELRRAAARDTATARAGFAETADRADLARFSDEADREALRAQTAAARALSEQINAQGHTPPLTEE